MTCVIKFTRVTYLREIKKMEQAQTPKKKKALKIIIGIIAVLLLVAAGVALRYWLAFSGFLDKITGRKLEMKSYSVVVTEESPVNEIEQLAGKNISFLDADNKVANAEQYLQGVVSFEASYYTDANMMVEMLKNNITDAIVLETDRIEILKEEVEELMNGTRVVYTYEIELEAEDMEISDKEITKEPFIVYISGSDSRNGIKAVARSDVNIVAVVNPKEAKILLVSIPRDTYVQLHDTTGLKDKLTHAGIYGINKSKTTIEDFLGIKIDYTIKVSFETVVKVVDQLDGIEITSDKAMTLKSNGEVCNFIEGKQLVNGNCALRFARERKSYTTGDRHRGENQQQVITSIIGKLSKAKDYLLKVPTILDIAGDSFETTFSRDNIMAFLRMQLSDGPDWKVTSIAIDGTGTYQPTYSMGSNLPLYVMIPSTETINNAKTKINEFLAIEEPEEE